MFWSFLTDNWEIMTTLGVAIAWLFDIRKRKYETKSSQGEALDKIEESYSKFLTHHEEIMGDLQNRLSIMEQALQASNDEGAILKERLAIFEKQAKEDKAQIIRFSSEIEGYKKRISELEKQIGHAKLNI